MILMIPFFNQWFNYRRRHPVLTHPCRWLKLSRVHIGLTKLQEGNVLFNDALNTFYLRLYGVGYMVKDHSDSERETRCRHIVYSFRLIARVLLYAPSHRQDSTYYGLCYTGHGSLVGTRNSSMGPPWRIDPNTLTTDLHLAPHERSDELHPTMAMTTKQEDIYQEILIQHQVTSCWSFALDPTTSSAPSQQLSIWQSRYGQYS